MGNKAYIVANEQQEREVLEKLEREAVTWWYSLKPASQFIPSKYSSFPYGLKILDSYVVFAYPDGLENYEIVFDGRKEERMSEKYVVSQEVMNGLKEWKDKYFNDANYFVSHLDIRNLPHIVSVWKCDGVYDNEANNRLIAIIRWINGEDVFEVEKPKKWIVRSKEADNKGNYMYGYIVPNERLKYMEMAYGKYPSAYFDTKEEAEGWANSHQEVVEVKE